MMVDEALRALRHDPADSLAWETVYQHMQSELLAYVSSLLLTFDIVTADPAHDVIHEAIVAFWRRWPAIRSEIRSPADARAYLRKSCRNLLLDRYRHQRHAQQLVDFLALNFTAAFGNEANVYRHIFVSEIIAELPPTCASLLRAYVNEDLSPAEIAEREDASPSAFYSRWYRCLEIARGIFVQKRGHLERS